MVRTHIIRLAAGGLTLISACLLVSALPAFSDSRTRGRQAEIQVQTDYDIGQYQTDTGRAIDMAERVALQNQQAVQAQLVRVEAKLDRLSEKLDSLEARLAGIEKHFGITPPPPPAPTVAAPRPQKPASRP